MILRPPSFTLDRCSAASDVYKRQVSSAVKVRGNSSVSGSNEPLYIVNGSFVSKEDFSKITAQAIKSTEVLRGENATAIYGSVATNGAVVVTLKDGLEDFITVSESELDLSYDIDIPFDVPVSYTHLRAHETVLDLVCRLLLEKKKKCKSYNASHTFTTNDKSL